MSQTIHDQNNSRRVRTHEKNSGETVRRLGTIIQSIYCAQSGAGICLNFWKYFGESRYPGALSPLLENFRRALSFLPTRPTAPGSPRMVARWFGSEVTGYHPTSFFFADMRLIDRLLSPYGGSIKNHFRDFKF